MSATASLPELPEMPRVSVLTLTYNHERFVAEAIESVLAQGWPADRLQHVVLNDGSSDGTSRALDPYRSHVTVVEQENAGMNASVDRAMRLLTGDVITVVDGDDVMLPGRIERQIQALRDRPGAGLVYTDAQVIDPDGRVLHRSFIDGAGLPRFEGRIRGKLLARNFVSGGALMMRGCLRDLLDPLPAFVAWPDYWWAWAISGVADVVHVPEPTYGYRAHGGNQTLGARDRHAANVTKELPFRLHMLADVQPDQASAVELVTGIVAVWKLLEHASADAEAVLTPTPLAREDALRWLARAFDAQDAGDLEGAALACARAAARNLRDPALFAVVRSLARRLEGAGPAPAPARDLLDALGARGAAVLADADRLLAEPELLDAYASRFDAGADVTLVIHADGAQAGEIPRLVAERGLDGDDAPDMVLTSEPPARLEALTAGVDAILGRDTRQSAAPAFGVDDLDSLALLLRRRRSPTAIGAG